MTIKDNIEEFQEKLKKQLHEHDCFISQWENVDWHERCVLLDKLLHGMWSTYEDAEDIAAEMKEVFPPYPFSEIKDIKKQIKEAAHRIEDFVKEEYACDADDGKKYLDAYNKFLKKVCRDKSAIRKWHSRETIIIEKERELLDMLNNSYSIMLELLLSCNQSQQKDSKAIILAYSNSKMRYEQLHWMKEKKSFHSLLAKKFVWGEPTEMQLQDYYRNKLDELGDTRLGKLYLEHDKEDFILEIAKLDLNENELKDFFRDLNILEELQSKVDDVSGSTQEDGEKVAATRKAGPPIHYLFCSNENPAKENVYVKNRETHRFMQYMKAHDLSSRCLCCFKNDKINEILTCFIIHWKDMNLVAERPSGRAIYRFMTEDCGFQSDVTIESYSNEIMERLEKKAYSIQQYKLVSECFKK